MEGFIGQIIMFAGTFAPRSWAFCDGQLLPIAQNTALFSILGTTYGGDGRTTFGLPDLRGRVAIHPGNGPGLSSYRLGEKGGAERNFQPPAHTHPFSIRSQESTANQTDPAGHRLGEVNTPIYTDESSSLVPLAADTSGSTGVAGGVGNIQPFQCINFIIALQGVFPSRS